MKTFRRIKIKPAAVIIIAAFFLLPVVKLEEPSSTVVFDRRGILLGATVAADGQWRFPGAAKLPTKFTQALLCYEDRRFYLHPGIDLMSLCRAMRDNLRANKIVSGGSTITMQVVRLSRHGRPRTMVEKMIEMMLAIRMEWALPKSRILALYAAHAPFGGNVVGLEAASWRYFGRPSDELSWAESAMLAVLPNSPSLIHPGRNRAALESKRNRLLQRLYQSDKIDSLTYALAMAEPLPVKPLPLPMTAPHLVQRIFKEQDGRGSRTRTTIDAVLQKRCSSAINRRMKGLLANSIGNVAALVLDVRHGAVLVYLGNVTNNDPQHHPQVDIITSPRSTGSLLKPFLYAGMLESGDILPTTLVPDIPTQMGSFAPKNYNRGYEGAVPAFRALARSLNVPAVRMLNMYGVDRFYDLLLSLGLTTLFRPAKDYGLALILGGAEGTLWDLTAAYAHLARCAEQKTAYMSPHIIQENDQEKDQNNRLQDGKQPLSAEVCRLTLSAMQQVTRPGEEQNWEFFTSSQKIAWKTGTSFGFRDGWAIGITPEYAVGVWVGNADGEGRPGLTGISTAAPILFDLFDQLESPSNFVHLSQDLVEINVCAQSGYRAGPYCEKIKTIKAPPGCAAGSICPFCRTIHCDAAGEFQVNDECEAVVDMKNISWFVLPPTMEWFYRQKHTEYKPLPPFRADCQKESSISFMSLIRQNQAGAYFVPIELEGEKGRIVFEATHRKPGAVIYWHLDDQYITATRGYHQVSIAPSAGDHVLTLVDELGERLVNRFTVLAEDKN